MEEFLYILSLHAAYDQILNTMNLSLDKKTALVTGAARGIGLAICESLLAEGAAVIGIDVIAPEGKYDFKFIKASVADEKAMNEIIMASPLDILVNNAAIARNNLIHKLTEEDINSTIEINLKSVFKISRDFLVANKNRGGVIINIASVLALIGAPLGSLYGATKGAVLAMTRSLAMEWAKYGFRINAVCPGMTETEMTERTRKNKIMFKANINSISMKRFALPKEIADVCVFLASDRASYITGQGIVVDGGLTVH